MGRFRSSAIFCGSKELLRVRIRIRGSLGIVPQTARRGDRIKHSDFARDEIRARVLRVYSGWEAQIECHEDENRSAYGLYHLRVSMRGKGQNIEKCLTLSFHLDSTNRIMLVLYQPDRWRSRPCWGAITRARSYPCPRKV